MSQSESDARLRRLEDLEAIRQLKYRYCAACDDSYDPDRIAVLFTMGAVWDGGPLGRFEGREAIRTFFAGASKAAPFAIHQVTNPIIEIDGDQATGAWYLWEPIVMVRESRSDALWMAATYDDRYVRAGDAWLFDHVKVNLRMLSPYEEGFAKTRFVSFE